MEDSTKNVRDPFDPFSDKEEVFETKNIRASKAGRLKSKTPASFSKKEKNKKKPSLFSRIKTFFKELPEREDKKKVYFKLIFTPILVCILVFLISTFIISLINERNREQKIEETKAEIESAHTDFFLGKLNEEEDLENYKLEIEEKYNSTDDPDLKFLYRNELIRLHIDNKEKNKEVIGWINEQLSYKKISTIDKVNLLVNLIALYRDNGMTNGLNNALNELMNIPDDGEMAFEGETLTELKTRIKNENS